MKSFIPRVFIIAAVALLAAVIHGSVVGGFKMPPEATKGLPPPITVSTSEATATPATKPTTSEPATAPSGTATPTDTSTEAARFHEYFAAGVATFIDARNAEDYREGHIPGAFLVPMSDVNSGNIPKILDDLDKNQLTAVYCGGGDCEASHNVASVMIQMGFKQVYVFEGGFPAWKSAGYPVDQGDPIQ